MLSYTIKRILALVPLVVAVVAVAFVLIHLAPGNPVELLLPSDATAADIAATRHAWGLDKPLPVQFLTFLRRAVVGNFGHSLRFGDSVTHLVLQHLPATLELAVSAIVLAIVVSIPLGAWAAVHQNSWVDSGSMLASLVGISIPGFWLGLLLILVFGGELRWLPVAGRLSLSTRLYSITGIYSLDSVLTGNMPALIDSLRHLLLPAVTLAAPGAAVMTRLTRSAMLEVLRSQFVQTARAKGLSPASVIWKHTFRNALVPVVTVIGLQLGFFLSGSIVVESVFSWPGLGQLLLTAVSARDYPLVQGIVFFYAMFYAVVNLAVDLSYAVIDPRIRY